MDILPHAMHSTPCCHLSLSLSSPSPSSSIPMSTQPLSSSLLSDPSPLTVSSSPHFSSHIPGPSCPDHCHSHLWQPSPSVSLPSSPSSSTSAHSLQSTATSLSSYSSASSRSASTSSFPAIESLFPTYQTIYPTTSLPELHDAHSMREIFKRDGQWTHYPTRPLPAEHITAHPQHR